MDRKIDSPCIMTIFGGTGDLTHRKLIPALYNLFHEGMLPQGFLVVGVGRKDKNHESYREELKASVEKHSRFKLNKDVWELFSQKIHYYRMEITHSEDYDGLKSYLNSLDTSFSTEGNRLYYLSVAPSFFETVTCNLHAFGMAENNSSWQRLIIEKPFGHDLKTAQYLNKIISEVFPQENIFRIDHYLGKEMLQNILVIRFGNAMFESFWNSRYIENIQITSSETLGIKNRADYYDSSGALRDMLQNHMLQLLALVAMEPPASIDAKSIRDEKIKLLRSITRNNLGTIKENIVRGQYSDGAIGSREVPAYRNESGIPRESNTETFIAASLMAGNFRWGNMPFYLRTGKRMRQKITKVIIEFKSLPEILYFKEYKGMQPNLMEIRIQPSEGVSFSFNAKKPGTHNEIANVKMDFCQNCSLEHNSPEAYERLLADALKNDQTLFTSWDEIEASWMLVDNIAQLWNEEKPDFPNYKPDTFGPPEADELLAKKGHKWWNE
ncbi:MAG TPA: glucose-6-phosphate dehydrogenase [Pseudobacteroides sp.]|uniref:glucose-6-phosphate dehydrogenase n=1 Tax=Pseudobacteroides sp. TaxID=1968840 RepID=UPI002F94020A